MLERDRLSSLICEHWQTFCPALYRQLQQSNRLSEALSESCEQMTDLLYQLFSVQKLEFHQAWEIATSQLLLTEESA